MHPLYHHSLRLRNRPVTVHLADGRSHYGMIQHVTPRGIHFMPMARPASTSKDGFDDLNVETAERNSLNDREVEPVYWGGFFFPFGLLAGFTLGFAAGAFSPWFWW